MRIVYQIEAIRELEENDTDQYTSTGASVGAFLAAIAALLTVRQIAKQRPASYRPEVVIPRGSVITLPDKDDESLSPLLRWRGTDDDIGSKSNVVGWEYSPRLVNIGMGTATSVSAVWDFPIETFVEETRERARKLESQLSIEYKNGRVSITKHLDFHLDYVLPASVEKEPLKILVPSAYIFSRYQHT